MKKFEFYKKLRYEDGSKFEVRFSGDYSKEDVNEEKLFSLMRKFMDNPKLHESMYQNVSFIRTILREINENLLEIKFENKRKEEVILYGKKKILFYNKINKIYENYKVSVDIELQGEEQLSLVFKTYDNTILDYHEIIKENSSIIYDIERLKDIKSIELNKSSKCLIEIYKLFFNEIPDFSDDIDKRVQSMMSILAMFNVNLDVDYSFAPITDKRIPFSFTLEQIIKDLYPFGKVEDIEEPVTILKDKQQVIENVGKQIRDLVPQDKSLDDTLTKISKIAFESRYGLMFKSDIKEICDLSCSSKEVVKEIMELYEEMFN